MKIQKCHTKYQNAIRFLIDEHLNRLEGKNREKTPEEKFYDAIYLP
ncbi:unnamed protein product, partial [marine sediment metagenome]